MSSKSSSSEYQEILSDEDVFTSDFEELLENPPNTNVDGFEELGFSWLRGKREEKPEVKDKKKNKVLVGLLKDLNEKTSKADKDECVLLCSYEFSVIDLKCLLAYKEKASDAGFLWFANYLQDKRYNKRYQGCLIPDLTVTPFKDDVKAQEFEEIHSERKHNFIIQMTTFRKEPNF